MNRKKEPWEKIITVILYIISGCMLLLFYLPMLVPGEADEETAEETTEETEEMIRPEAVPQRFLREENGEFDVVTDSETGVQYLLYESGYGASHECTITVMYDSDGKPLTR